MSNRGKMITEFSRPVELRKINADVKEYTIEAKEEELKPLAQRLLIDKVLSAKGTFSIHKRGSRLFVEGVAYAQLQIEKEGERMGIEETIKTLLFLDSTAKDFDAQRLEENDVDDPWDCDILEGTEVVDLGEIVTQYISLSLMDDFSEGTLEEKVIELF